MESAHHRTYCQTIMRKPHYQHLYKQPDPRIPPSSPHNSWLGFTWCQIGLSMVDPPSNIDLQSERVGRAFHVENLNTQVMLAAYPACPNNPHVPPFPGQRPPVFDLWGQRESCFDDGSLGRWDPRRYPQLWDRRRPWLGFMECPLSYEDEEKPELWLPVSCFNWYNRDTPLQGGYWNARKLEQLFGLRDDLERHIQRLLTGDANWVNFQCYEMPWYDPIPLKVALRWKTWREGRDWLSRTLLYVAELKAMISWLGSMCFEREVKKRGKWPAKSQIPADPSFMGVWAQTIESTEEWHFVTLAKLPVYVLMRLEPDHTLASIAVPGSLSADEHFRINPFDSALRRPNKDRGFHLYPGDFKSLELHSPPRFIPSSLRAPIQPTLAKGTVSTSSHLSWKSYIPLDDAVFRGHVPVSTKRLEARRQENEHFAWLPPNMKLLSTNLDFHPLLSVIPKAKDVGMTYYREENDGAQGYWPVKLGSKGKKNARTLSYMFEYTQERVTIYSDYSFPGKPMNVGRIAQTLEDLEDSEPLGDSVDNSIRYYHREPLSTNRNTDTYPDANFVWTPPKTPTPQRSVEEYYTTALPTSVLAGSQANTVTWMSGPNRAATIHKLLGQKSAAAGNTVDSVLLVGDDQVDSCVSTLLPKICMLELMPFISRTSYRTYNWESPSK